MGKDPNCPKKPLTAYFRYVATIRAEVKIATGLNGIKLAPHLAARWKEVTPEEKAPFQAPIKAEMEEWKKKVKAYKKTREYYDFQESSTKKKYKKQPKDKNAPKRAMTSFFLYAGSVRAQVVEEIGRSDVSKVGKKIGEMWKLLSAEEKAGWIAKQKIKKEEYNVLLEEYQKTPEYAAHKAEVKKFALTKKAALKRLVTLKKEMGITDEKKEAKPVPVEDDGDSESMES